jgi:hypothetical protein
MNKSVTFLLASLVLCCDDQPTLYSICNCTGEKQEMLTDEGGIVAETREGFKVISVNHGIMETCVDIPANYQSDGTGIVLTGRMVNECSRNFSGYGVTAPFVDIDKISTSDDQFQAGAITIKIIKTEDLGLAPGFGYEIFHEAKNFRILQTEIPAQPGTEPFQTREDALRVAYLVAHKLWKYDDFPSVYIGELYFLKIIDGG